MGLLFEKISCADKNAVREMSEFAGKIFFDYYDSQLLPGQALYMREKFLSVSAIEEKLAPGHTPEVNFEFVKNEENGEKVGFMAYWMRSDKYGDGKTKECYLDKYYLDEKFRGCGYGKMMIDHLKIFCRENSLSQITLNVNKYNKTVAIYEKLGFRNILSEVNDIGSGYVMDDYVMRLELENQEKQEA